jgi:hypothetical protein
MEKVNGDAMALMVMLILMWILDMITEQEIHMAMIGGRVQNQVVIRLDPQDVL